MRKPTFADAGLFGNGPDLGHIFERLFELLRRRSKNGTFRRGDEVKLVQLDHGQRHLCSDGEDEGEGIKPAMFRQLVRASI